MESITLSSGDILYDTEENLITIAGETKDEFLFKNINGTINENPVYPLSKKYVSQQLKKGIDNKKNGMEKIDPYIKQNPAEILKEYLEFIIKNNDRKMNDLLYKILGDILKRDFQLVFEDLEKFLGEKIKTDIKTYGKFETIINNKSNKNKDFRLQDILYAYWIWKLKNTKNTSYTTPILDI